MSQDFPLYNSRIIKAYQDFLNSRYADFDINSVFDFAGMTKLNVEDPGHWFSQKQVDRFYEAIVAKTNNRAIAGEAGRYLTSSESLGPVKQCILGLINPASLYLFMGKIYPLLSRGATIATKKITQQKVEIISTPKPGVIEKPYQCENRLGCFESGTKLFTNSLAHIEHPECFHKGDDACRYIITWKKSRSYIWKKIRNLCVKLGLPTIAFLYFFLTFPKWAVLMLLLVICVLIVSLYAEHLGRKELVTALESQGNTAEALLDEMNVRHNNALLVQEVGQATSTIKNVDDLIETVIGVMERHSGFDRSIIMLANGSETRLTYADSFGYSQEQRRLLLDTSFHLNNPESRGVFVVCYKEQKPFLIDDIGRIKNTLSKRSLKLVKKMDVQSLICVPIVYEKQSIGILAVDNVKSKKPLTQSDINLLMGVASQTAVSLTNVESFQKLQDGEKKYRDLVESANSIIMRQDIKGNITFFNEFAQNLFGYAEKDILGKNILGTILPDSKSSIQKLEKLIADLKLNPENGVVTESRHLIKNSEQVWIAWTYKPIFNKIGKLKEILCIGNNITELKQAEDEKKELELRLQRAQKMEAVGALASGVAHDLNNILSGIVSYPELIMMELPENSPLRKSVQIVQKSGEKAAAIVQDLLTLARRGVVTRKPANLNDIVSEYLKSPEFDILKIHYPNVRIKLRLSKNLLNIMGSPVHLSKTIMNLVSNAAEAMPSGGTLNIKTRNRYIDKSLKGFDEVVSGDYVILTISDAGIGITAENIERIFEPFFTRKVMGRSGTGLGMAVVWGTVKDHGGYIDVKSTVGKGTKFTLYLPATQEKPGCEELQIPIEDLKGNRETILVVDDAEDQREIASNLIKTLNYTVESVASGEEAVDIVRHRPVDLLILDMIMDPGIDGYETYKQIVEFNPDQKAIIASGYSETRQIKDARKLGLGAYVKKPYLLRKIGKAIKEELNKNSAVSR